MMLQSKLFSYIYRFPVQTTVSKPAKPKASVSSASSTLAKTADSLWIAISSVLFVLGTAFLAYVHRC